MDEKLTTREAAERLGVKPETLYAYVSRGLIARERAPGGGRGSLFSAADVDALAARTGRSPARESTAGTAIRTELTLLADDRLSFRGRDVTELAGRWTFEAVAEWLWEGRERPDAHFTAPPAAVAAARRAADALPERARVTDRFRAAVTAAAVDDPLCLDLRPANVLTTARTLITAMVLAAPPAGEWGEPGPDADVAGRLWSRLTEARPSAEGLRALDGALALLADHDIAASTYAARVAASTRAHPYAVVATGLAALDGPLHGGAGALARRLLDDVLACGDAPGVLGTRLRDGGSVPGFGHRLYRRRDPRAEALLPLLADLPDPEGVREAARALTEVARERLETFPTIDFALAVLARLCGMGRDAEEAVFATARTAGWIAHALEEYRAPAVRHRPQGLYVGHRPVVQTTREEL